MKMVGEPVARVELAYPIYKTGGLAIDLNRHSAIYRCIEQEMMRNVFHLPVADHTNRRYHVGLD